MKHIALGLICLAATGCAALENGFPGNPYAATIGWIEHKDPNCQAEPCKVIQKVKYVEAKSEGWNGQAIVVMDRYMTSLQELDGVPQWTQYSLVAKDAAGGAGLWTSFLQGAAGRWGQGALNAYGLIHQATDNIVFSGGNASAAAKGGKGFAYGGSAKAFSSSSAAAKASANATAKSLSNLQFQNVVNMGMPMGGAD